MSQTLLPRAEDKGRIAAFEIMTATPAIRNLIRDKRHYEIPSYMQIGKSNDSMQTMDEALADLVQRGKVTREEATMRSSNPERVERTLTNSQETRLDIRRLSGKMKDGGT